MIISVPKCWQSFSIKENPNPYINLYLILANIHSNVVGCENFQTYYLFKDKNEIYTISHLLNVLTKNEMSIIGYEILNDIKLYIKDYQKDHLFLIDLNKNIENVIEHVEYCLQNPSFYRNIKNIMNNYLKDLLNLEQNNNTLIYNSKWFEKDNNYKNGYIYSDKITDNEYFYNSWLEMAEYKELVKNLLRIGIDKMNLTDLLIFMAKTVDSAKIEQLLKIYKELNKNIEIVVEISYALEQKIIE